MILRDLVVGKFFVCAALLKQEICAACSGRLRRAGYERAKLRKICEEMIALDKESIRADYAKEASRFRCAQ
ncbi:MAG: hypothetical protein ACI4QA_03980 [Candidatus Spyradosoma sp.]